MGARPGMVKLSSDAPSGCIVAFILLWIVGVLLSLAVPAAIVYALIKFAGTL